MAMGGFYMSKTCSYFISAAIITTMCFVSSGSSEAWGLDSPKVDGTGSTPGSNNSGDSSDGGTHPASKKPVTINVKTIPKGDTCTVLKIGFCVAQRSIDEYKIERARIRNRLDDLLIKEGKLLKEIEEIYWLSKVLGTYWYKKIKKQLDDVQANLADWHLNDLRHIKRIDAQIREFEKTLKQITPTVMRFCNLQEDPRNNPNFCNGVPDRVDD